MLLTFVTVNKNSGFLFKRTEKIDLKFKMLNNKKNYKISIIALPSSAKPKITCRLSVNIKTKYFNADEVYKQFNDWDFTLVGRGSIVRSTNNIIN